MPGVPVMTDGFSIDGDTESVRGIVEQHDLVPSGDLGQFLQFARIAVDVDGKNGSRPWGNRRLNLFRVEGVMIRVHRCRQTPGEFCSRRARASLRQR